MVDHGDAYPRSIVLVKYSKPAGNPTFTSDCTFVNLLKFLGQIGDNATGASIGGFEVSQNTYLVAGNYKNKEKDSSVRNIFLSIMPKDALADENTRLTYLTNYSTKDERMVSTPQLVKINDNRFMVLWEEEFYKLDDYSYDTYAVLVDENGKKVTDIQKFAGRLSDCKPIAYQDQVVWYYTDDSAPIFCSIPSDGSKPIENAVVGEGYTVQGIDYLVTKRDSKSKTVAVENIQNASKTTITISDAVTIMGEKYLVTEVKNGAFQRNDKIKKIIFGRNITKIESLSFSYYNQIRSIEIKSTKLKSVNKEAISCLSEKAVIKVPKSKLAAYKRLLKGKGQSSKVKIIKL